MKKIILLLTLLPLAACAQKPYTLTINTNPQGANIINSSQQQLGFSPITRQYQWDRKYVDAQNCLKIAGFNAQWASGATNSSNSTLRLCPDNNKSHNWQITINRPSSAPGLDKDFAFAQQVEQARFAKQQQLFQLYQSQNGSLNKSYQDLAGTLGQALGKSLR